VRISSIALTVLAVWAGGMALAGCANYTQPIAPPQGLTVEQKNFEALWQGSLDVLRANYFVIDRQDRRAGVITTKPLLGRHWFELWRHDAAGWYNKSEGTLQTVYRTAEVRIRPAAENAGTFTAAVLVQTSRTDRVARQVTNVSEAYSMFTLPGGTIDTALLADINSDDPLAQAQRAKGVVKLGPDRLLSEKLTRDINAAAARRIGKGDFRP
jgi:hypothetical protein